MDDLFSPEPRTPGLWDWLKITRRTFNQVAAGVLRTLGAPVPQTLSPTPALVPTPDAPAQKTGFEKLYAFGMRLWEEGLKGMDASLGGFKSPICDNYHRSDLFCDKFETATPTTKTFSDAASFFVTNVVPGLDVIWGWRQAILDNPEMRSLAEGIRALQKEQRLNEKRLPLLLAKEYRLAEWLQENPPPENDQRRSKEVEQDFLRFLTEMDPNSSLAAFKEADDRLRQKHDKTPEYMVQNIMNLAFPDSGWNTCLARIHDIRARCTQAIYKLCGHEEDYTDKKIWWRQPDQDPVAAVLTVLDQTFGFYRKGNWRIKERSYFMPFDFLETDPAYFMQMMVGNCYEAHRQAAQAAGVAVMGKEAFLNELRKHITMIEPKAAEHIPSEIHMRRMQLLDGLSINPQTGLRQTRDAAEAGSLPQR